ncbi:MAG: SRPBCC family protein, partial [Myxococcota bacterium]
MTPAAAPTAATAARASTDPVADPVDAARAAVGGLEAAQLTSAPLRARAVAQLDASVEEVWSYVSNHQNLVEYAGATGIKHASIDNSAAMVENGVGCKRECLANENDRFVEEIVYFRAPYVYAYSAYENTWGLTDHLGVVIVRPLPGGKAELEWRQYFNTAKPEMAAMMAKNMQGMLSGPLLGFFVDRFGGAMQRSS